MTKRLKYRNAAILSFALLLSVVWQATKAAPVNVFKRRYSFISLNWKTNAEVEENKELLNRIKNLGYNMVCFNNGTVFHIQHQRQSFIDNFKKIRAEAERIGMPLAIHHGVQRIPSYHDLNLAEAYPAKGTQFQVTGTQAVVKPDHDVSLVNGGFDEWSGAKPNGWNFNILKPGSNYSRDAGVKHSGSSSLKITNPAYGSALHQAVVVKPFRAYRLSVWVKTSNYSRPGELAFAVKAGGKWIQFIRHGGAFGWGGNAVGKNQSWKKSVLDFNSLNYSAVQMHFRLTNLRGPATGTVWLDDMKIEEVGLYEAVTRKSAPVKVTSAQSGKVYKQGTDYKLDIKAEFLYQGKLIIPTGSAIQNGELLKVDWYQLANTHHYHAPAAVGCIDEYYKAFEKDFEIINDMFDGVKAVHIGAGEWRQAFWDPSCTAKYRNAGEYMADVARLTTKMFRKMNPNMEVSYKNDMYDPYHNAHADYYAVNGDIKGAWHGITPDVFMWNWRPPRSPNANKDDVFYKSLMHFGGLDPQSPMEPVTQIIRINGDAGGSDVHLRLAFLDLAEKNGLRHVEGIQYNTWYNNYAGLDKLVNACKAAGRWADNPYPGPWPEMCPNGNCASGINGKSGSASRSPNAPGLGLQYAADGKIQFSFNRQQGCDVELSIVNMQGQLVHKTVTEPGTGSQGLTWDAKGVPAGIYIASLRMVGEAGMASAATTRKLAILN